MAIYKVLEEIMKDMNLSVADAARICKLPDSTVRGILRRRQETVALDVAFKLSDGLGVSLERLNGLEEAPRGGHDKIAPLCSSEAMEIAETFDRLDGHGQGAVKAILGFEQAALIAEQRQAAAPGRPKLKVLRRSDGFIEMKVYDQPAAAGLGNYLDDPAFHIEQYPADVIPDGTDFGIRISGDSMSPEIPHGATVFVQSRSTIEPGKIGIFLLNEEAYCKKLAVDRVKGQIRLVSLNPAYQDRLIEECDDFHTMGVVLGRWPR